MTRTLYLVRHTTPGIAPGICYGQLDVNVSANFAEEAARTLGWLPRPDLIVTSPLLRAARLAEYLAQAHQCELRRDDRLMEKHFGAWEGKAWDSIARPELDAWAADFLGYAPPGGESAQQVMLRTQSLLQHLTGLPASCIAVVAHVGIIRAMLARLGGLPLHAAQRWEVPCGTVIGIRY